MRIHQTTITRVLGIIWVIAILVSCGGKPAEFNQTAGEMKEGPGFLTGKEGAFTLYDSKQGGPFWDREKAKSGESAEGQAEKASAEADQGVQAAADAAVAAGQTVTAAGGASGQPEITPETAREFQEFQDWKREQNEFREFQEWKKTSQGAAEYKEFLEWKEWKSYQEWKKRQGQ